MNKRISSVFKNSISSHLQIAWNRLLHLCYFLFFILWRKTGKRKINPTLLIIAIVFTGCFQHYFRTNTQTSVDEATMKVWQNSNKYFVIHSGYNGVFGLNNMTVSSDRLKGSPVELTGEHFKYINPRTNKANQVGKKRQGDGAT